MTHANQGDMGMEMFNLLIMIHFMSSQARREEEGGETPTHTWLYELNVVTSAASVAGITRRRKALGCRLEKDHFWALVVHTE